MTQEKPPDQPVFGSMSVAPLPTRKMWGNSTCQWKKRYWRVRSATSCSAAARSRVPASAAKFSRTAWVIAVERVSSVLGWTNAAHQASARSFWMRRSGEAASCFGLALLVDVQVFQAVGERVDDRGGALGQDGVGDRDAGLAEQVVLALAFGGVLLLQRRADLAVVAFDRGEGGVGQAFGEQGGGDAEQGVADADVLVEVGQRLAGFQGFQPERDLGQFGGHRVDVYAVDAAADHAAEGLADLGVRGLGFAGFLGGDALGDAAGGGDEEVAGAAGGVADGEVEQRRDLPRRCPCAVASSSRGSRAESSRHSTREVGV